MRRHSALFAAVVALFGLSAPAPAAEAPFQPRLLRLAEVLGSLHYLRNLCGEEGTQWRDQMQKLIEAENPAAELKARYLDR